MSVESSSGQPQSEKPRLQVRNRTEDTAVASDVVEIDTSRETFSAVAQRLKGIANGGIWLNHYRGIPRVSFMPELDIVYLDEYFEVLRCVEGYRQASTELPDIAARSAIVLAAGQLSAARIQSGHRLEIRETATGALRIGLPASVANEDSPATDEVENVPERSETGLRSFFRRLLRMTSERRKGKRHVIPGSVAYFSIGSPQAQEVRDISTDGFYVKTDDRWSPGTTLLVGLEIVNPSSRAVEAMISVRSKVVRTGTDGVAFVYDDELSHQHPMLGATDPEHLVQLQKFMQRIQRG